MKELLIRVFTCPLYIIASLWIKHNDRKLKKQITEENKQEHKEMYKEHKQLNNGNL